jgi:hypothetical protein
LAAGALLGCAAPACAADTRAVRGCEVSDLAAVFRDPAAYAGRKFCGEVFGIPDRVAIAFYPPGDDDASDRYDVAMFLSDRRASDRLLLSQTGPFRVRVEGRIRLLDACFSAAAAQGRIHCTPFRRPIRLLVSRIGSPVAAEGR